MLAKTKFKGSLGYARDDKSFSIKCMFKKTFLILALLGFVTPVFVFADKFGIDKAANGTDLIQSSLSVPELIGSIVGIALSFVGIVFFLLILYAGFLWMTAFGNDEKVTSAKSIMEHAVLGLIIVLSAYAISKFVFSSLPGGGGQTIPASAKGCCVNPATGGQIENLESQCVANAQNPRTWKAGPCVVGCCYVTVPPADCEPRAMGQAECQLWGNRGSWQQGACANSCP